jgi:predicted alpha/beta-hydrolase family hydrolase
VAGSECSISGYALAVKEMRIGVGGSAVSASVHGSGRVAVALGHGAGGNRTTPFLLRAAEALARSGRMTVLFNFPYTESRRRIPDTPAVLEDTVAAVAAAVGEVPGVARIVLGGKSMGGRIASQAVAKGTPADALAFLGYPLHPPGRPEKLRDRHLPAISVPMLFLQGTRDTFARWDLIETVTSSLGDKARLERLEDADHSFAVPKRTGRSATDVEADLFGRLVSWLDSLGL